MANCIAKAIGIGKTRNTVTHRLGSVAAEANVSTWRTHVIVHINKDGSGCINVVRDDITLYAFSLEKEGKEE